MPVSVQIVTSKFEDLLVSLKEKFGYSVIDIKGLDDSVTKKMILVETTNKHTSELTNIVNNIDANAFIIVNETKFIQNGFFK